MSQESLIFILFFLLGLVTSQTLGTRFQIEIWCTNPLCARQRFCLPFLLVMGLLTRLEVRDRGRKCKDLWCHVAGCCGPTSTPSPTATLLHHGVDQQQTEGESIMEVGAVKHGSDRRTCLRTQRRPNPHLPTQTPLTCLPWAEKTICWFKCGLGRWWEGKNFYC